MALRIRSALPGRVRWDVPDVRARPDVAAALTQDLSAYPGVEFAAANSLTGRLLLQFDADIPATTVEQWVVEALARAKATPFTPEAAAAAPLRHPSTGSALTFLLERTQRHRGLVGMTLASSFFTALFEAVPPIMIGTAVDAVTRGSGSFLAALGFRTVASQLMALGGISVIIWTLDAAATYAHKRLTAELANVVRHDLRNEVYAHLQRLDIQQIEQRGVSRWMTLIDDDLNRIHKFVGEGTEPIITIAADGVIVAVTYLLFSPALAAAQLLMVPPLVLASMKLLGPVRQRFAASRHEAEEVSRLLHDNISGMPTIAAFNSADAAATRVAEASERHLESEREAQKLSALYVPTLQMIVGAGFITTLVWGGSLVNQGKLPAGAYNMMGYAELRLLVTLARLGSTAANFQQTRVSMDRIVRVLEMQPTIRSGPIRLPERTGGGELQFENVVFGYEADRPVLKGMTMRFAAGRTTGIVGETGAGKSTILKLLLRFYDRRSGAITLDGIDIQQLALDDLRRVFALVPQDVVVFGGTVRDNIAYARPDATLEDVVRAAKVAEADAFIERLPRGYDTLIGNGSRPLSTGQRQRIAIARAALADRPVLLFDEATSGLDSQTEAAVQRSLEQVTAGRTTVIVAHRLSTIRNADHIYVIDDGQVREEGTHDELLDADGVYASMWRVQTGTLTHRTRAPKKPRAPKRLM